MIKETSMSRKCIDCLNFTEEKKGIQYRLNSLSLYEKMFKF